MKYYKKTNQSIWTGRASHDQLYMHEKIRCINLESHVFDHDSSKIFGLLGYACDEGVVRNQGRVGAVSGPDSIRKMLASLSNHFKEDTQIVDAGSVTCPDKNLEQTQESTSLSVQKLLSNKVFPIVLGGGHDLAYAHYRGIKKQYPNQTIGIINLDAHFDLRQVIDQGTSGTPFYQIAQENDTFNYLCLGIQKASNNRELYKTAANFGVQYLENDKYTIANKSNVQQLVGDFMASVDMIYLTIDIDGFSSVYAPGVSAPSPMGFAIDIALDTIEQICNSNKLISCDIVELNPIYDKDNATARLAARLVYQIIQYLQG
ncbi:formimidoylglutamase [Aquimarina sp. AU474]|uniref:formimidoylglutamase n=1 Tax=Aquimarina sp. AU474 TaxID=2108529 RepID=UPI000D696FC4|nr:formimidoylglutamase [Aquimarina sp. AU474]